MLSRRGFLGGSLASLAVGCARSLAGGGEAGPGPLIQTKVPGITHGVQAGDPQRGRANVWARCDEPARMIVEWDTTPRFAHARRVGGVVVTPEQGLAGLVALEGLPDAQQIFYRVWFEREAARGASIATTGRLVTPRADRVRVAWTGDTCGQGYGRNPEWGGLKGYAAIRNANPDVFVHSGDLIYADNPILAEKPLSDGRIWKNVTNDAVGRVAETLDDFRARFAYNLEDEHVRALAGDVAMIAQWDDHETHNNWWPGQTLDDPRYTRERDVTTLAGYAKRATFEWTPITRGPIQRVLHYGPLLDVFVLDCRSFRTPNGANLGADAMLGAPQVSWLLRELAASTARWKLIACDQPIAIAIPDAWPPDARNFQEGFANGDPGPPRGRERELATLLAGIRGAAGKNAIWVTADVHYAAAHHFDPGRATGVAFDPFWEFVAGPIHAGCFSPPPLDATLGPEVRFQMAPPATAGDVAPWDDQQSFGTLDVTREAVTVILWGVDERERYRVEIPYVG